MEDEYLDENYDTQESDEAFYEFFEFKNLMNTLARMMRDSARTSQGSLHLYAYLRNLEVRALINKNIDPETRILKYGHRKIKIDDKEIVLFGREGERLLKFDTLPDGDEE